MILEDKDREKFIQWLEVKAETCKGMAEQMERIPSPDTKELAKIEKIKAGACLLIANDLKNVETTIIEDFSKVLVDTKVLVRNDTKHPWDR